MGGKVDGTNLTLHTTEYLHEHILTFIYSYRSFEGMRKFQKQLYEMSLQPFLLLVRSWYFQRLFEFRVNLLPCAI